MQDGNSFSEQLMQVGSHCRSQPDFGDQQNGRAPGLEHRPHRRKIDCRLARPGDPVQQHAGKLARVHALLDKLERRLLRRAELRVKQAGPRLQHRYGEVSRLLDNFHQPALDQRVQSTLRDLERLQHFDRRLASGGGQSVN